MSKEKIFNKLISINKKIWQDDDRMDQETLFDLQDELQTFLLEIAKDIKQEEKLVKEFPFLYKQTKYSI